MNILFFYLLSLSGGHSVFLSAHRYVLKKLSQYADVISQKNSFCFYTKEKSRKETGGEQSCR